MASAPEAGPGGAAVSGSVLSEALARIASDVDAAFDAMLPVPADPRARLVEVLDDAER